MIKDAKDARAWNTNSPACREIFCAALQGICANPSFFGALFQQSPQAAVEFADSVVIAAVYAEPKVKTTTEALAKGEP